MYVTKENLNVSLCLSVCLSLTDCGRPPKVIHGHWIPGPILTNSMAHYKCKTGYVPVGKPQAFCSGKGIWDKPSFKCSGTEPL